jgi:hypothetical protein
MTKTEGGNSKKTGKKRSIKKRQKGELKRSKKQAKMPKKG